MRNAQKNLIWRLTRKSFGNVNYLNQFLKLKMQPAETGTGGTYITIYKYYLLKYTINTQLTIN